MHRILFICHGNICRSCTAQTIMQHIVDEYGMSNNFIIDSAGIIDYHEGEMADARMRKHASKRGYNITHLSRPVSSSDFYNFDYIIGMDNNNLTSLHRIAPSCELESKIHMMTEWCEQHQDDVVLDPYYGGSLGFEKVLDLLEDACQGLFNSLCS